MSWEIGSLLVTAVVGLLPLVVARRHGRAAARRPVERTWRLSIRVDRHRR